MRSLEDIAYHALVFVLVLLAYKIFEMRQRGRQ